MLNAKLQELQNHFNEIMSQLPNTNPEERTQVLTTIQQMSDELQSVIAECTSAESLAETIKKCLNEHPDAAGLLKFITRLDLNIPADANILQERLRILIDAVYPTSNDKRTLLADDQLPQIINQFFQVEASIWIFECELALYNRVFSELKEAHNNNPTLLHWLETGELSHDKGPLPTLESANEIRKQLKQTQEQVKTLDDIIGRSYFEAELTALIGHERYIQLNSTLNTHLPTANMCNRYNDLCRTILSTPREAFEKQPANKPITTPAVTPPRGQVKGVKKALKKRFKFRRKIAKQAPAKTPPHGTTSNLPQFSIHAKPKTTSGEFSFAKLMERAQNPKESEKPAKRPGLFVDPALANVSVSARRDEVRTKIEAMLQRPETKEHISMGINQAIETIIQDNLEQALHDIIESTYQGDLHDQLQDQLQDQIAEHTKQIEHEIKAIIDQIRERMIEKEMEILLEKSDTNAVTALIDNPVFHACVYYTQANIMSQELAVTRDGGLLRGLLDGYEGWIAQHAPGNELLVRFVRERGNHDVAALLEPQLLSHYRSALTQMARANENLLQVTMSELLNYPDHVEERKDLIISLCGQAYYDAYDEEINTLLDKGYVRRTTLCNIANFESVPIAESTLELKAPTPRMN